MADHASCISDGGKRTPRKSKATRWRAGVLLLVHVLAAIHIGHWLSTGRTVSPLEPSESMEFAKYSVVNSGLIFFGVLILSTLLLGRWFCGWACHLVALQDLSRALLIKVGLRPRPLKSRWMGMVPLLAGIYMFLWPLIHRVWIGDPIAVRDVHLISEGDQFWRTFTTSWLMAGGTFLVCGGIVIYFLGAKGFCTYACPYGGVFGVVDKVSPGRIRVTDDCAHCGHCTLTCTSNVDVAREVHDYGMVVDPGCMKCMDCVSVCPEDALYFGFGKPALLAKPVTQPRPPAKKLPLIEEAVALGAFAFAYLAYRGYRQESDFLLSLGLASVFAFACVLLVRLVRRADVKVPGVPLKKAGRLRPMAAVLGAGTLGLAACAVPYGIVPAVAYLRADDAWAQLQDARVRTETPGASAALSEAEKAAAETLLDNALVVHERSQLLTAVNTDRVIWGALFTGRTEAMRDVLMDVVGSDTAALDFRSQAVGVLARNGFAEEAESAARTVLGAAPGDPDTVAALADLLARSGRAEEIDALVADALTARPDDPKLLMTRSNLAAMRGEFPAAEADLRRIVELAPDNLAARGGLVRMLVGTQRADEAIGILRAGLEIEGAPPLMRAQLAELYAMQGKREDALREARVLAEGDLRDVPTLEAAEALLRQLGDTEAADAVARRRSQR